MLNVVGLTDLKRVLIYDMVFHPGSINMCDFQVVVSKWFQMIFYFHRKYLET